MRRAVAALSAWLLIILMVVPGAAAEGEEPAGSESTAGQLQQTQAGNTEDSLPYRTYIKRYTDSPAGTGTAETPASLYMENRGAVSDRDSVSSPGGWKRRHPAGRPPGWGIPL